MKKTTTILITALITLSAFFAATYTSCKKDACSGVACLNGGTCGGGTCACASGYTGNRCETKATTSIIYVNPSFTPMVITINGVQQTIPVGGSVSYTGQYGSAATGTAITAGETTGGTPIGLTLTNNINDVFPASGAFTHTLDISSTFFFLKVTNNSADVINTIYVNYGLTNQTVDYVNVPNDGQTYYLGYYKAFTNSTARFESATHFWSYPSVPLSFANNQSLTLTAN